MSYGDKTTLALFGKHDGGNCKEWNIEIGGDENAGINTFDPPGDVEDGNDWVLVLDDPRSNYSAPGQVTTE